MLTTKQKSGGVFRPWRADLAFAYAAAVPPTVIVYDALTSACVQQRDYPGTLRAFHMYAAAGMTPSVFEFSGLISLAGKAGELEVAADALKAAVDGHACDVVVFNAFVDACARAGDYPRAAQAVDWMRRQAGGLFRTSTRPTLNVLLLLLASV